MKGSKKQTWIASSFDEFDDFGEPSQPDIDRGKKRRRDHDQQSQNSQGTQGSIRSSEKQILDSNELWAVKHSPKCAADLAVHKKKVTDLQGWLDHNLKRANIKQAPILLLTGPSGAGKTATVQALAQDDGIQIQEWVNPVEDSCTRFNTDLSDTSWRGDYSRIEGGTSQSQTTLFQDFLLRANRYNTLQIFGDEALQKKIILVEDYPNNFFRDPKQFHSILRNYQTRGQCPLVFIVSDSAGGDSNERLLFPKDVQAELNVFNMSFNPINMTSMVKTLSKIATVEATQSGKRSSVPNKQTLEALYDSSVGDIRGAINALQFACLKDTRDLEKAFTGRGTLKKSSSSKKGGGLQKTLTSKNRIKAKEKRAKTSPDEREESLASIGGRDTSLFLFRALGKILYCKRGDEKDYPEHRRLPEAVSHLNRDPLLVNPEEVLEKSHLSGEFFTAFLQQNYLEFYKDIEDVVEASQYISDSDYLTVDWTSRAELREYAASVSARALMFCNKARAHTSGGGPSGLGFKPLHKPQWFSVMKKGRENREAVRRLFCKCGQTPIELQTQYLPYVLKINKNLYTGGQGGYLKEVTSWHSSKLESRCERLDEKDVEQDDGDTFATEAGQAQTTGQPDSDEEETAITEDPDIIIEDFDDD